MVPTNVQMQPKVLDVLIVGGGLSGLFVANSLSGLSLSWKLLEATDQVGGRLQNAPLTEIDMGGAWIWPEHQPHMRDLVKSFGIPTFRQPDEGSSTRVEGGAEKIADVLAESFKKKGDGTLQLNSPVVSCKLVEGEVCPTESILPTSDGYVEIEIADGTVYSANQVVFAIPPRLLLDTITFNPPLSPTKEAALASSKTWMAGVTKVALVYKDRFWDLNASNMGLPSQFGPAFQVYDSSTKDGSVSALTFFTYVPPDSRAQTDDAFLAQQVAVQMESMWKQLRRSRYANRANSFTTYHVYRWPQQYYISGKDNKPGHINPHPTPVLALAAPEWNNKLLFAGTESDLVSPGVMEGAVGAAKRVLKAILQRK